ncbi:hypothetical protein GGR50DRAFT_654087 [Xylaria sp. CBS 124048]|nr:hypothetical protein GGR50DRAFT_654087 [Xylaria sp. CBS 124048]
MVLYRSSQLIFLSLNFFFFFFLFFSLKKGVSQELPVFLRTPFIVGCLLFIRKGTETRQSP